MNVTTQYSRLFDAAKAQGKIRGVALDVYSIICSTPGLTGGEIFRRYENLRPGTDRARNEIAKRITDLANWGAVKADGLTICPESGRQASRWVPTGAMPEPKREDRSRRFQVVPKMPYPTLISPRTGLPEALDPRIEDANKRITALDTALNTAVELAERRAETISTQNKEITRLQNSLSNAELARRCDSDLIAGKLREAQVARERAEAKELTARQELADLKASALTLDSAYEDYVRQVAFRKDLSVEGVIRQSIMTYQAFESGELVERRKRVEEQKSPAGVEAKAQIQALASRNRLLLKFRRFLPKRLVQQAEATLRALDFATEIL